MNSLSLYLTHRKYSVPICSLALCVKRRNVGTSSESRYQPMQVDQGHLGKTNRNRNTFCHTGRAGAGLYLIPCVVQVVGLVLDKTGFLWPMFTLAVCFVCSLPFFLIFLLFHFFYSLHSFNAYFIKYVLFPRPCAELHRTLKCHRGNLYSWETYSPEWSQESWV